jgi:hypothetical protein
MVEHYSKDTGHKDAMQNIISEGLNALGLNKSSYEIRNAAETIKIAEELINSVCLKIK